MKELYLIDGYNLIHASKELRELLDESLELARVRLLDLLEEYAFFEKKKIILVYDGHKVKNNRGDHEIYENIEIYYTKENETADSKIEKLTSELIYRYDITAVSSDFLEQTTIFSLGALRKSSHEFYNEMVDSLELAKKIEKRRNIKKEMDMNSSEFKDMLKIWVKKNKKNKK